jgi:hypothetical protein
VCERVRKIIVREAGQDGEGLTGGTGEDATQHGGVTARSGRGGREGGRWTGRGDWVRGGQRSHASNLAISTNFSDPFGVNAAASPGIAPCERARDDAVTNGEGRPDHPRSLSGHAPATASQPHHTDARGQMRCRITHAAVGLATEREVGRRGGQEKHERNGGDWA